MKFPASSSGNLSRRPGQSILDRGVWRALSPFLILLFLSGLALGAAWCPPFFSEGLAVAVLLVLVAGLVWAGKRAEHILERHSRGVAGEERVARVLAALGPEWAIFHDVVYGRDARADHVVIGAKGVFVIETINWQGRIRVEEGRLFDDAHAYPGYSIQQILQRAEGLRLQLSDQLPEIIPVVCAAGGRLAPMPNPVQGVWFAETHSLLALLERAGSAALSPALRDTLLRRMESFA